MQAASGASFVAPLERSVQRGRRAGSSAAVAASCCCYCCSSDTLPLARMTQTSTRQTASGVPRRFFWRAPCHASGPSSSTRFREGPRGIGSFSLTFWRALRSRAEWGSFLGTARDVTSLPMASVGGSPRAESVRKNRLPDSPSSVSPTTPRLSDDCPAPRFPDSPTSRLRDSPILRLRSPSPTRRLPDSLTPRLADSPSSQPHRPKRASV